MVHFYQGPFTELMPLFGFQEDALSSRAIIPLLACVVSLNCLGCLRGHFGTIPPPPDLGGSNHHGTTLAEECGAQARAIDALPSDKQKSARNNEANRLIMAIRHSHDVYNGRLSVHRSTFETTSDLALLASTAVSTINPGAAIGATSLAITGAKASVDKNYYNDLSRTALLIDIYKNAQGQEDAIVGKLSTKTYSEYSVSDACRDLDAFFRSGEAIRAVSAAAATPPTKPADTDKPAD